MTSFANEDWQSRTRLLVGDDNLAILKKAHVAVFGLGGVGAITAEMLCRAGIGQITIVDHDTISATNRNRQIHAFVSNENVEKTTVMSHRLKDINPELQLTLHEKYVKDHVAPEILDNPFDYVVDAIDSLSPKVFLLYHAMQRGHRIVSALGSGGRLNPLEIKIADLSESYNCPFAVDVRKKLHKLGIYNGIKVIFSSEKVNTNAKMLLDNVPNKKSAFGTISYLPNVFGCYAAAVVINDLINNSIKSQPS